MAAVGERDGSAVERVVKAEVTKFLVRTSQGTVEGHRGLLLAMNSCDRKHFIVLATTCGDGVVWGKLYLVAEENVTQWPYVVRSVEAVPDEPAWGFYWLGDWDNGQRMAGSTTAVDPADVAAKPPAP